ncbi:MAG: hypothetical protein ABS81_17965 [Pseudonocardia sp. SCN 72-86]|nr:MAG: hypothetical protein ABS81_17965 [Pseudonocardia sp. SCN 72-86]
MPVTTTVGALAVAAALAAGAAPGAGAVVVPAASTCTVSSGGTTTSGAGRQLTAQEAQQLLEQTRELVTSLSYAGSDTRAVALSAGIRSLGITPAVSTGWRQEVHDLADTTVVAMDADAAAGSVAVALARAGFSPTPADLRHTDGSRESGAGFTASAAGVPSLALSLDGMIAAAIASLPAAAITVCGIDAGTSDGADWSAQADRLLERLEADPDPDAKHLADLITKARNGSDTVNDTETRTGNRGSEPADDTRGTDAVTERDTGTSRGAGAGTDRDAVPDRETGTETGTGSGTRSGSGAQGWEAKARALAEQLETAGDDPIARRLSDQLAAQGITAGGGSTATDRTRDAATDDQDRDAGERDDQEGDEDADDSRQSGDTAEDGPTDTDRAADDEQSSDDEEQAADDAQPRDDAPADDAPADDTRTGSTGGDWDRLAQCESSGNWSIDTGNGYKGGLQFDAAYLEVLTALRHVSCWRPWVPAR